MPEGRAAAERARTDDRDLPVCSVPEPCIEKLRPVLVPVKSQAEPAIDQVLYEVRVHVIGVRREAFGGVMPDGNSQPVLQARVAQSFSRNSDTSWVDGALPVKQIVVVAA